MSNSPIIVALDYDNKQAALNFVEQISPADCRLKIGKEMFTLFGPQFIEELQKKGFDIFLDLKFHDIPNTVAKAIKASAELGVWMVNVHASGGIRMMEAAKSALLPFVKSPKLIAVTVLTSMGSDDLKALSISLSPAEYAEKLAQLTYDCDLDGVVCSALEAMKFKSLFGSGFELVTPGIRPEGSEKGDQCRVMTPKQAVDAGADYMVIGRPITQASDPVLALKMIQKSLI